MYRQVMFGKALKQIIAEKQAVDKIGEWAHDVYMDNLLDIDLELRRVMLSLNAMECGPEFARSYEELDKIADDLIAGKKVIL